LPLGRDHCCKKFVQIVSNRDSDSSSLSCGDRNTDAVFFFFFFFLGGGGETTKSTGFEIRGADVVIGRSSIGTRQLPVTPPNVCGSLSINQCLQRGVWCVRGGGAWIPTTCAIECRQDRRATGPFQKRLNTPADKFFVASSGRKTAVNPIGVPDGRPHSPSRWRRFHTRSPPC